VSRATRLIKTTTTTSSNVAMEVNEKENAEKEEEAKGGAKDILEGGIGNGKIATQEAAVVVGNPEPLPVCPAHAWYLKLNSASDVYGNINNYHTIAGSGAFNGRTINVEGSTYGAFQHSANPAQKDLDDLGKLLDQMKNDYVQFSKDSFEKRGVELAVEAKILNKGDGFDDLLKKFKKYTKAEIADQQHVFDEILLIERKFTREVFANWAKRENLNVKITDPFFGSKNKRLTQPQKGYSGHSGYYFVQEAAGQVVKKVKDQTKAGARRMVNMRVRPSKGGIVEGATVKRPPHTSVLVDLVDEKSPAVVIKIEADQVKQSSQAKIAKQIIKKFSLSTDVESALKELVEGTYGSCAVCHVYEYKTAMYCTT